MRSQGSAAILALLLGACTIAEPGPTTPAPPPATRLPGQVLIDREARQSALAASPEQAERYCGAPDQRWRSYPAPEPLAPTAEHATDTRLNPFAWVIMRGAAAAIGTGDQEARATVVKAIDRWARSQALAEIESKDAAVIYGVNRLLLPTIVAWSLVRDAPEVNQTIRRRVDAWLIAMVERSEAYADAAKPTETITRNNHHYLSASVSMALGSLIDDPLRVQRGIAAYRSALAELRPDGSLPLETARGARALWYQRHAIASLVTIAEMGALLGYDLYGLKVEGRSLHDAVGYLARAVGDPELVAGYAAANVNPGPSERWWEQELGFLETRGHGRHYMAWLEPYLARFPRSRDGNALADRLGLDRSRPLVDEYGGGNLTCFFAPLRPPVG